MSKPGWWLLLMVYATNGLPASATVMAGDREWLQPADFLGFSWADFDIVCPAGDCAGSLGGSGPDITGWTWAAIDEVGTLFSMLSPHEGGIARYFTPDPAEGFDIIGRSGFEVTSDLELAISFGISGVAGYSSTLSPIAGSAYWGVIQVGLFPGFSRGTTIDTTDTLETDLSNPLIGAWLYRVHAVPLPSGASLVIIGLALLLYSGRRNPSPYHVRQYLA